MHILKTCISVLVALSSVASIATLCAYLACSLDSFDVPTSSKLVRVTLAPGWRRCANVSALHVLTMFFTNLIVQQLIPGPYPSSLVVSTPWLYNMNWYMNLAIVATSMFLKSMAGTRTG